MYFRIAGNSIDNRRQNCIGIERLLIHSDIYQGVVDELEKRVSKLTQGAPMNENVDCGAMTMLKQALHVHRLVTKSVEQGAKLLVGGVPHNLPHYYPPTLLVDVEPHMAICKEEVFGPVMVIMKFKDDKEAIDIVNQCEYKLGSNGNRIHSTSVYKMRQASSKIHQGTSSRNVQCE